MMELHRYWFEFEIAPGDLDENPSYAGLSWGCGVTAYNYDDAVEILRQRVFKEDPLPEIARVVKDIDISQLDEGHVRPNMTAPSERGIWFPAGVS
jgi:hypothetical protein